MGVAARMEEGRNGADMVGAESAALSPVLSLSSASASASDGRMASMQGLWESEWSRLDQRHSAEIQRWKELLNDKTRELAGIKEEHLRATPNKTQQAEMALTVVEAEMAAFASNASAGLEWLEDVLAALTENILRKGAHLAILEKRTKEPGELRRVELERVLAEQGVRVESLLASKANLEGQNAALEEARLTHAREAAALGKSLAQVQGDHHNLITVVHAMEVESKATIRSLREAVADKEAQLATFRGELQELQHLRSLSVTRVAVIAQIHNTVDVELGLSMENLEASARATRGVAAALARRDASDNAAWPPLDKTTQGAAREAQDRQTITFLQERLEEAQREGQRERQVLASAGVPRLEEAQREGQRGRQVPV
ncbi:hypothetical protein T484DRAFT_1771468 [Baffinella frigidus]|nr:hypothetical protein T484DRAFT_1771468 [Cryptophyta sp. CCMP2293]